MTLQGQERFNIYYSLKMVIILEYVSEPAEPYPSPLFETFSVDIMSVYVL